jgi:hypothetical protein
MLPAKICEMTKILLKVSLVKPRQNDAAILKNYEGSVYWNIHYTTNWFCKKKSAKHRDNFPGLWSLFFIHFSPVTFSTLLLHVTDRQTDTDRQADRQTGKIVRLTIGVLSSFCVLDFSSPACGPNFVELSVLNRILSTPAPSIFRAVRTLRLHWPGVVASGFVAVCFYDSLLSLCLWLFYDSLPSLCLWLTA